MNIIFYLIPLFILKGEVINQTLERTQKNVKIYLYKVAHEGNVIVDSTVSGARGKFRFECEEGMYMLRGLYRDVVFRQTPFFVRKDTSVIFPVWEITDSTDGIEISRVHMAVMPDKDGISVTEVISFQNFTDRAFYKPFEVELPSGIKSFSPFSGIFPEEVHLTGNKLLYYLPVIPGKQVLSFQYIVPEKFEFNRKFPFKTILFEIYVSPELKLDGYGKGEVQQIGDRKYIRFILRNIEQNKKISFRVTRLKKFIDFKEILPIAIVLILITIFIITRWKKR